MTNQVDRAAQQFEFVWGSHGYRQVGPAFSLVEEQMAFHQRAWPYVNPWRRIGTVRTHHTYAEDLVIQTMVDIDLRIR